jgi:hypothetical protein
MLNNSLTYKMTPAVVRHPGARPGKRLLMTEVYRKAIEQEGEGRIVALNGGAFVIPSFTQDGVAYKTHPESGYCSCSRHFFRGDCEKHVAFAASVAAIRELESRSRMFLPTLARINEEKALRLCRAIFSKVERGESAVESYELLLEVMSFRFGNEAMKHAAIKRHGRVLALNNVRGRAA